MTGREDSFFVLGRIDALRPDFGSLRGYAATAGYGGRVFDQTTSDGTGRFLLELDREVVSTIGFIDLYVTSVSGARVGAKRVRLIDLDSPQVVLFKPVPNPVVPTTSRAKRLIRRFSANGEPVVLVDSSCSDALLEWDVAGDDGSGGLQLLLAVERQLIARDLPMQGSLAVSDRDSAEYTLAVRRRADPGAILERQTVIIRRFPTLSLYFEGTPNPHRPFRVGVAISCPAPEQGLPVLLVSSNQAMMENGSVVVQSGERWGSASLAVGAHSGEVEVTGLASGYLRDTVSVKIPTD